MTSIETRGCSAERINTFVLSHWAHTAVLKLVPVLNRFIHTQFFLWSAGWKYRDLITTFPPA